MKKLRLAILTIVLAGTITAPDVFAYVGLDGTLIFTNSTFQNGVGGEFNAVTSGLGSFGTFCIEDGEFIGQPPSGPYTYTINSGAVQGGPGTDAIDPHTGLSMDNVSIGTAWLYSNFANGTLTLDDGTGSYFDANRLANAGELQNAIWFLEGEGGQNNGYVALAETALSQTLPQIEADSNGAFGVVALNLFDANGNLAQDQLAVTLQVVPEPASTNCFVLCLGVLVGWRYFQKRKYPGLKISPFLKNLCAL